MTGTIRDADAPDRSLNDILRRRAAEQPTDRAYVFLSDGGAEEAVLTFAGLAERASAIAAWLAQRAQPGDRALLTFPPGLDFIVAFFGCLLAGVVAVPMMPPRRAAARDSSDAIIADCDPRFAFTTAKLLAVRPDLVARYESLGLAWLAVDAVDGTTLPMPDRARSNHHDPAFLQYTSGSTSAPKGVMVTHANLLANLEMIRRALGNSSRSGYVSWVPLYHDMGLILSCLETFYLGSLGVLMGPAAFMQRPLNWLRAISRYKAEVACAPNFAYQLCVDRFRPDQMEGVDLSGWQIALNGAEPVRAATLAHFASTFAPYGLRPETLYPAYGMAEATLLVSGGVRGAAHVETVVSRAALLEGLVAEPNSDADRQVVVGCGRSVPGGRVAIADADTGRPLGLREVGEVRVGGDHVASGYWGRAEETRATFGATLEGFGDAGWLRTGDLGFLDAEGELYITGRLKDLIIIRGMNHHPHDIEDTVQAADPALRRSHGAAFATTGDAGAEKLVVVQEIERGVPGDRLADIEGSIREAVADAHELAVDRIVLIRPGTLPKTTSGKIQRRQTRQLWLEGKLAVVN